MTPRRLARHLVVDVLRAGPPMSSGEIADATRRTNLPASSIRRAIALLLRAGIIRTIIVDGVRRHFLSRELT